MESKSRLRRSSAFGDADAGDEITPQMVVDWISPEQAADLARPRGNRLRAFAAAEVARGLSTALRAHRRLMRERAARSAEEPRSAATSSPSPSDGEG